LKKPGFRNQTFCGVTLARSLVKSRKLGGKMIKSVFSAKSQYCTVHTVPVVHNMLH
jgi:hypothetical protein